MLEADVWDERAAFIGGSLGVSGPLTSAMGDVRFCHMDTEREQRGEPPPPPPLISPWAVRQHSSVTATLTDDPRGQEGRKPAGAVTQRYRMSFSMSGYVPYLLNLPSAV